MPRLRPRTSFSAAFIVVAACGEPNPPNYSENPPPPELDASVDADIDATIAENPPPACDYATSPLVGCNECFVGVARGAGSTDCAGLVCSSDPYCCTTSWDEACVDRADRYCEETRCATDLSLGGAGEVTLGVRTDAGYEVEAWTAADATPIRSLAWADFDRDSRADAAVVTDCFVRIERNGGWLGTLQHTVVFESAPTSGCASLPAEERWGGRRARWADVDGDNDLVVAGRFGVVVIEHGTGGGFSVGDTVMAAVRGEATDVAIADLDGDAFLDAIVSIDGVGTRVFRHTQLGWTEDVTWTGPVATQLELCPGGRDRNLVIADGSLSVYRLLATGVGAQVAPTMPDAGTLVACVPGGFAVAGPGATPIRVVDGVDELWASDEIIDASALDVGELDDGATRIVVASATPDAPVHVFTQDVFPSFTYAMVPDLVADNDTTVVELVSLQKPGTP